MRFDFDSKRREVVQLLRDHKIIYQAGMQDAAVEATQEYRNNEHWNLTDEQIKRHFEDSAEARSHVELEKRLRRLRARCSPLAQPAQNLFLRSDAGDKDLERLLEQASGANVRATEKELKKLRERIAALKEKDSSLAHHRLKNARHQREQLEARLREQKRLQREAEHEATLVMWCLDLLAVHLKDVDLRVDFARPRGKMEEDAMEKQHAQIYAELLDLRAEFPSRRDSEHKRELADRYNCSTRTLDRIIEAREGTKRRTA